MELEMEDIKMNIKITDKAKKYINKKNAKHIVIDMVKKAPNGGWCKADIILPCVKIVDKIDEHINSYNHFINEGINIYTSLDVQVRDEEDIEIYLNNILGFKKLNIKGLVAEVL